MRCGGKCYKMIEKNRGNEVILEMVEALKNKNFEFPRVHGVYERYFAGVKPADVAGIVESS